MTAPLLPIPVSGAERFETLCPSTSRTDPNIVDSGETLINESGGSSSASIDTVSSSGNVTSGYEAKIDCDPITTDGHLRVPDFLDAR